MSITRTLVAAATLVLLPVGLATAAPASGDGRNDAHGSAPADATGGRGAQGAHDDYGRSTAEEARQTSEAHRQDAEHRHSGDASGAASKSGKQKKEKKPKKGKEGRDGDEDIYGAELMSEEERRQYRDRLGQASADAKERIRAEHQVEIQNRARERGQSIPPAKGLSPDQPPVNPLEE